MQQASRSQPLRSIVSASELVSACGLGREAVAARGGWMRGGGRIVAYWEADVIPGEVFSSIRWRLS